MTTRTNFPTVPIAQVPAEDECGTKEKDRPVILVVDDDHVIADTLSAILDLNGYAAMTAYDGHGALELARLVPPELLITDVVMPYINGIDLAVRVRHAAPDCKVILFSGQAVTLALLEPAGGAGNEFGILRKPVHPAVILDCVAKHLTHRRAAESPAADVKPTMNVTVPGGRRHRGWSHETPAHSY